MSPAGQSSLLISQPLSLEFCPGICSSILLYFPCPHFGQTPGGGFAWQGDHTDLIVLLLALVLAANRVSHSPLTDLFHLSLVNSLGGTFFQGGGKTTPESKMEVATGRSSQGPKLPRSGLAEVFRCGITGLHS